MPSQGEDGVPAPARYEGLDSFRVVGIYVVILFHFHMEWAPQVSLGKLVQLRGCAFPIVILTSFFVLSRSVLTKPGAGFGKFVTSRFKRVGLPFLIWTAFYWGIFGAAYPLRHGGAVDWPGPSLLLSGYIHLWFLQFIFLGSIVLYPLLLFMAGRERLRWQFALFCFVASLSYAVWVRPSAAGLIEAGMAHSDRSLQIFFRQVNNYMVYVPAAVGIALCAERVSALYERRAYRVLSLAVVAAAVWVHLANESLPFTKGFYSLAVFLAILQTPPAALVNALRPVAMYSYPIYILHFLVSHVFTYKVLNRAQAEATPVNVLLGSLVVFGVSLLASVLLRRLFPRDWFLPLIPIRRRQTVAAAGRHPRELNAAHDGIYREDSR